MIAWLLVACTSTPTSTGSSTRSPLSSATYTLAWADPVGDGVRIRPGGGWTFTTDQGFVVQLEAAELVSYATWLNPCPDQRSGAFVLPWMGSAALAGHSLLNNPTASRFPVVEDLTADRREVVLPTVRFEAKTYCQAGTLLARGDQHTRPADHQMNGKTLHIKGTWTRAEEPPRPFDITTPIAHSGTTDLVGAGTGPHLDLRVERTLTGLFDNIDLENTVDARIARGVLANLMNHTRFTCVRTLSPQEQR